MHSFLCKRSVLALGLLAATLATVPSVAEAAKPRPGKGAQGFRLFARSLGALTINRVYCGLSATGEICVDSTNSSTIGGGFWPKGTADQYVFNSGLQLAGTVAADAGFDWAGDTTGAFFFDPKGTTQHGELVAPIYNMSSPDDLAAVSDSQASGEALAARVPVGDASETLFYPLLRGRTSASQGDVWFLTWDGNPGQNAGRSHPLGVLVEQRGMGWNFPAGNEDIIYFIYTFYNVTAAASSGVYENIRDGMQELVEARGDLFQQRNEAAFDVDIPDGGYTINNLYAAFSADMDVAEATANYASVNVPFALGYTYEHTFSGATGWTFDPGIFASPFFAGAGFVGVKYLKSPVDPLTGQQVGLTLFSNTINGGAFDDAQNTIQLYRYLSGNISVAAGDAACTAAPLTDRICYVNTGAPADMRFFQSSGPLTLGPGEFQTIVVAYIFAAPVTTGTCTGPGTCDLTPGDPRLTSSLTALTGSGLNPIDSVAGYRGFQSDLNGNGAPEQTEYELPVSNSLMGKALVAQQVFDIAFLLPFAPEAPEFFTVPGDNQVSVLWRPSPTEASGDPFFTIASQVTITDTLGNVLPNPLYDPNYRQLDVEGYRVYRGRVDNPNELQLLAQFDYSGTFISDFAGQVNPTIGCAPELGVNVITPIVDPVTGDTTFVPACPVPFDTVLPGVARTVSIDVPLVGQFTQVKLVGGRDRLANNTAIYLVVDTAMTGNNFGAPDLSDNGVPFVYVDRTARNNLRYFYSVTAFDVNSFQSGPSSIESPRNTKPATPSHAATNFENDVSIVQSIEGRGVARDTSSVPSLNPTTGMFSGPFPAANGWTIGLGETISQILVGSAEVTAHLDSLQLGSPYQGVAHNYFFTASASGLTSALSIPILQPEETGLTDGAAAFQAVQANNSLAGQFGGNDQYRLPAQVSMSLPGPDYLALYGRGCVNNRPGFGTTAACAYNGSRWFAGPSPASNETQADPIAGNTGNFSNDPMTGNYNNAGALPGVTTIHQTQCYQSAGGASCRPLAGIQSGARRAADFNVHWGTGGLVDSVIDVTHNVPVAFDSVAAGTWGILNQAATAVGAGLDASATLTNADFACVEPFRTYASGGFLCPTTTPPYRLSNTAVPGTIGFFSGGAYPPTVPIDPAVSTGFAMYLAGDMFTFELAGGALPAAGTVWSLRSYVGAITGGNGAGGNLGPYSYSNPEGVRPLTAVGVDLKATLTIENQVAATTPADLRQVHTVPDPYYVTNQFEQTTDTKIIKFVNLPNDCIIRIYSSSGVLVSMLEHRSTSFGGSEDWNVRNRNNQVVASGVYFYHIESGDARRVGRFTVVNFAE
jgi:hypothetical protein